MPHAVVGGRCAARVGTGEGAHAEQAAQSSGCATAKWGRGSPLAVFWRLALRSLCVRVRTRATVLVRVWLNSNDPLCAGWASDAAVMGCRRASSRCTNNNQKWRKELMRARHPPHTASLRHLPRQHQPRAALRRLPPLHHRPLVDAAVSARDGNDELRSCEGGGGEHRQRTLWRVLSSSHVRGGKLEARSWVLVTRRLARGHPCPASLHAQVAAAAYCASASSWMPPSPPAPRLPRTTRSCARPSAQHHRQPGRQREEAGRMHRTAAAVPSAYLGQVGRHTTTATRT